jgi:hypothetical protein
MENFLVLKDFLSLKQGDVINLHISSNIIYVIVGNREIDVTFYGNDKGKWGKDNPAPKSNNSVTDYIPNIHFKWVKEKLLPFTAMEFSMPKCPKDLTKHNMYVYSGSEWERICMQKVIDDLKNYGVI